jgi:plasmid stability protein
MIAPVQGGGTMGDILVRGIPPAVVAQLKEQARAKQRSLQQEIRLILEEAASRRAIDAEEAATRIRMQLSRSGRAFSDSATLLREDRER